jgi:tRNA G18 (ribose-2'-O)-methylase SpoU
MLEVSSSSEMLSVRISALDDPRIAVYADVGHPDRLRAAGRFVAEGRLVVRRLVESRRFEVESVLVTPAALRDMADVLETGGWPIFVVSPSILQQLTGFDFHRGCLALAQRSGALGVGFFATARRLLALEAIGNPDNVGGLFRVAAAFAVDGMALSPACGDPFYRKAVRTSMGAVLRVPFAIAQRWPEDLESLRAAGLQLVALTPEARAEPLREFVATVEPGARLILMCGAEGAGLTPEALRMADRRVRIPIAPDVDSLNVVVAAGIVLSALMY